LFVCAVGLIESANFLLKESASTGEFRNLRFIILTVFSQCLYFLLTLRVLSVCDRIYFLVESFDFLLKGSFLYLKFGDGELQLGFLLCKLLDLLVSKSKLSFNILDFLVILFLHSGLLLRNFSAHGPVILSQRLNFSL